MASGDGETNEKQAEVLFVNRNISEIRLIEQRARLDIERKKEELRQLVGERYRDMIEGSDSVISMKESCVNIVGMLASVKESCSQIQQKHFIKGTGGQEAPPILCTSSSTLSQIRLMIELQDKCWSYLDNKQNLSACLCYLLSKHTNGRLRSTDTEWPSVFFQVWQATNSLKGKIVQSCHSYLQSADLEEKNTLECLIVMILLGSHNLSDVFDWFLADRQKALSNLLERPSNSKSAKEVITEIFHSLKQSIVLVSKIFTASEQVSSSLENGISDVIHSKGTTICQQYAPLYLIDHLPDYIKSYTPQDQVIRNLNPSIINARSNQWLNDCLVIAHTGIRELLSHIASLKGLASVRGSVYSLLTERDTLQFDWCKICQSSLGEAINLYCKCLQPILIDRAKGIIDSQIKDTQSAVIDLLNYIVNQHKANPQDFPADSNMALYLWSDTSCPVDNESVEDMLEGLKVKANGCTPQIHGFCQTFNQQLQTIIDDVKSLDSSSQSSTDDVYWKNDLSAINVHIEELLTALISKFLNVVDDHVAKMQSLLATNATYESHSVIDRVLLLARLCFCLTEFTPNIKYILSKGQPDPTPRLHKTHHKFNVLNHKVFGLVQQKSDQLYKIWYHWLADVFGQQLKNSLDSQIDTTLLVGSMNWEDVTIKEETEKGEQRTTVIVVPSQASIYVMATLFALCQELTRIGSHNINRTVLCGLTREIFQKVVDSYWQVKEQQLLSQECALQLLYDIRFYAAILCPIGWEEVWSTEHKKHIRILDVLKSFIDPFDYDVYIPHLNKMLNRQLQRSNIMLGPLFILKGQSTVSLHKATPAGSYQEKHIVVPLSNTLPRLSTLHSGSASHEISNKPHSNQWMDSSSFALYSNTIPSFSNICEALQHF